MLIKNNVKKSLNRTERIRLRVYIEHSVRKIFRVTKLNLFRKEVIQPHLPVRLPCYDLAPVTGFTFGAC